MEIAPANAGKGVSFTTAEDAGVNCRLVDVGGIPLPSIPELSRPVLAAVLAKVNAAENDDGDLVAPFQNYI